MRREAMKLLYDIQQAGLRIARFTAGKTVDDYLGDEVLRSAVKWEFATVGEALGQLLREAPEMETEITEARGIVDFRNRLIHGYSKVEEATVWDILILELPRLLEEVTALLADESPPPSESKV